MNKDPGQNSFIILISILLIAFTVLMVSYVIISVSENMTKIETVNAAVHDTNKEVVLYTCTPFVGETDE